MTTESANRDYIQKTMVENWRREMEAAALYELSAQQETNERRKGIFAQLADVEYKHARMWEEKLRASGYDVTTLQKPKVSIKGLNPVGIVQRIEAIEDSNATWYRSLRNVINDEDIVRILDEIDADEAAHGELDELLKEGHSPEKRLRSLWGRERHRQGSKDWVGDAIYGVNDGLGAIFGIISGVAGYTANTHTVLISGFFGAVASTLSMGAGAWLATKSENEVLETTLAQERREIEEEPEHKSKNWHCSTSSRVSPRRNPPRLPRRLPRIRSSFSRPWCRRSLDFKRKAGGIRGNLLCLAACPRSSAVLFRWCHSSF